jgi:hypothetical protein
MTLTKDMDEYPTYGLAIVNRYQIAQYEPCITKLLDRIHASRVAQARGVMHRTTPLRKIVQRTQTRASMALCIKTGLLPICVAWG